MSKISIFLKLCNKYGADFVLTSGASSKLLMKSPSELIAIGEALGLSHDQAVKSVSVVPEYILKR
jgi:RNase P/RNase MRP subunit p30